MTKHNRCELWWTLCTNLIGYGWTFPTAPPGDAIETDRWVQEFFSAWWSSRGPFMAAMLEEMLVALAPLPDPADDPEQLIWPGRQVWLPLLRGAGVEVARRYWGEQPWLHDAVAEPMFLRNSWSIKALGLYPGGLYPQTEWTVADPAFTPKHVPMIPGC